jgi:hypothetical protein
MPASAGARDDDNASMHENNDYVFCASLPDAFPAGAAPFASARVERRSTEKTIRAVVELTESVVEASFLVFAGGE